MRCEKQLAQRGVPSSLFSLGSGAMCPLSSASIALTALLLLSVPGGDSASADLQQATTDQRQLLNQINAACLSYLFAELKFSVESDVLGELCVLMLVQKSKELKWQENNKRFLFHYSRPQGYDLSQEATPVSHPLLHLVSQLHNRRERGLTVHAEVQGPGGIQSRGYFLYRPRNGRRSLENE